MFSAVQSVPREVFVAAQDQHQRRTVIEVGGRCLDIHLRILLRFNLYKDRVAAVHNRDVDLLPVRYGRGL